MLEFSRPKRLKKGNTVAVLSISWGGPAVYPRLFELGIRNLSELFGITVVEYPTARMPDAELHKNPRARAADINSAFRDDAIDAIVSSIGGNDSVRILPYIDRDAVRANPKIFMGYSDTTTVLSFANVLGLTTFYGPSIMGGLAQLHNMPPGYSEHLVRFLGGSTRGAMLPTFESWSDGYPDWGNTTTLGQVLNKRANDEGWKWIQGSGRRAGRLWGGCIEVLEFLKGTEYWPEPEFWRNRILFFEMSEEKPPVRQIVYILRNYGVQGVFAQAAGILFGRPKAYSDTEKSDLYAAIKNVIAEEFGETAIPVVANMDFGHTDPKIILPLGAAVEIDCDSRRITIEDEFTAG